MKLIKVSTDGHLQIEISEEELAEMENGTCNYHPLNIEVQRGLAQDIQKIADICQEVWTGKLAGKSRRWIKKGWR